LQYSQIISYFCETKFKGIKKTLKIAGFSIGGVILFLALIFILLQTSSIQKVLSDAITSELSKKLHTKVTVGKIEYRFFNDVAIHDLYVEDQQRDTLLFVKEANSHFKFWKFFHGKIIFNTIELNQLYGNLIIDKTGHSNIQFIIDSLATPQKNDTSKIQYKIGRFQLKNSRFTFTNLKELQAVPKGVFNPNKLNVRDINIDLSLNIPKKDSFNVQLNRFSAKEATGLTISDFRTEILASKKGLKVPKLNLNLPESKINLENIQLKYDSLSDLLHFATKVRWNAPIKSSSIAFSDLKAFVPEFKNLKGSVIFKGLITGRVKGMHFQKMEIKYGDTFQLNADLDVNGFPDLREAFIYGQIVDLHFQKSDLQDFISDLTRKPFLLPDELNQLGVVHYKGNITGFLNNLVLYGNVLTNIGDITTDVSLKFENELKDLIYSGEVKSDNLQLGKLLANKQLGKASFNLTTEGSKKGNLPLQGTIEAEIPEFHFNGYLYHDIKFDGEYDGKGFDGTADVKDENIDAHFGGKIDMTQQLPVFNFDLAIQDANLNALKITTKYPDSELSFKAKTNIIGNSLENVNGTLDFDNIRFTNLNKTLNIKKIKITSRIDPDKTNLSISSDFLNGSLNGKFKYNTLAQTINKIVLNYLPSIATLEKTAAEYEPNHINIDFKISNTKEISEIFVLPYTLEGSSTLKGYIDEKNNKIDISGNIPILKSNKQQIENVTLVIENPKQQLIITSHAQIETKDETLYLFLKAIAAQDTLGVNLGWQNTQQVTNGGDISAVARFKSENGNFTAQLNIHPTQIIVADSTWNIHPCRIDLNSDSSIHIQNFSFESRKQFIHINGTASRSRNDSISVVMNQLDLDFIMGLLKLKGISLGGIATGKATFLSILDQPVFDANIKVKNFNINHKVIGDANIFSTWDKDKEQILAKGFFIGDKNDTIVKAYGVYTPKTDTIDIMYDARRFSIEFLSTYFESVAKDFKGYAKGKIRMYGPLKHGVSFEGNGFVSGGQATIKTLQTTYFIDDSVHLTKRTIELRNIKVYDQERNPGNLNAILNHNGFFQHMKYDVNIGGQNVLAMNTHAEDNDYFFGKAYANGTVHIFGDEKEVNINVNAISQPNTKCYIQMGGASKASDNSFVNFINKRIYSKKDLALHTKSPGNDTNVKVNLLLEVNSNADMELIVDPKGGDVITGKGTGNLRVEFDTFSDVKMYGTYAINNGYYLFTLQNLIRKEFKIDQGSTLSWTGNPKNAQGNLRALYPLTASLSDLKDESLTNQATRSSVPVNCVLKLTDNIMKPTVKFDIDLPQSDEGVKQRVRNIINTDEMMNRQILYLLVFSKFYTPDYMGQTATANNIGSSEGISLLASTLSAQVNNWASQLFKSNSFQFGVDFRTNDIQSSDIKAQVLYQPNSRLLINGNFGYRTDNITTNASRFINDVDIQYLLTESGKLRFKAYNHTIDRNQQLISKTTQTEGLGFVYKEDFNSVGELLRHYWNLVFGKKQKKDETQTSQPK